MEVHQKQTTGCVVSGVARAGQCGMYLLPSLGTCGQTSGVARSAQCLFVAKKLALLGQRYLKKARTALNPVSN